MIVITRPLPRMEHNRGPRIVVMTTASGIRLQRCTAEDQAQMVAKQWSERNFHNWPGECRTVKGAPCS